MIRNIMRKEDLSSLIGNRQLYIWGSGHFGASICYAMSRIGIEVSGFIDSNLYDSEFLGFQVKKPNDILAMGKNEVFIIISVFLFMDEISRRCDEYGFSHSRDYFTHAEIKPYHFEIDVAGCCNLRCLTCPRGNSNETLYSGMISFENYKMVLEKLLIEVPMLSDIQLYSWGEPLLNPELPDMIRYTASKGLATAVSSNLSLRCNLESAIKAKPTWFRVSLSGSDNKTYSIIHRGGKFDLVLKNLKLLSQLRKQFAPNMFIEVNYHLYKHNIDGALKMAQICKELNFVFRTNYAFIDPLDSIIEYAMGNPLSKSMQDGQRYLLLEIDDAIKDSQQSDLQDCVSQNSFVIHSDLSFRRCTHLFYSKSNIIAENFLETPLDEILRRGEGCEICRICREQGVHGFHFAYINKGTEVGEMNY